MKTKLLILFLIAATSAIGLSGCSFVKSLHCTATVSTNPVSIGASCPGFDSIVNSWLQHAGVNIPVPDVTHTFGAAKGAMPWQIEGVPVKVKHKLNGALVIKPIRSSMFPFFCQASPADTDGILNLIPAPYNKYISVITALIVLLEVVLRTWPTKTNASILGFLNKILPQNINNEDKPKT